MEDSCTSGFFGPDDIPVPGGLRQLTVLTPPGDGPFVLYKYVRAGRIVVLKAIREELRGNFLHEEILKKEFEIGRSLNHPNIREYYSLCTIPGLGQCIEMEWVDGCTLEELMPACREDSGLCDKIASQIIDAVRFIHLKQVIHRDLKPSNILITHNGQNVKLIDFSLSDSDTYCILKGHAGSARYASPEQVSCSGSDFRSDIYSLGVILSEMSDRRRYRNVAAKCTRKDMTRRYKDISQLETALFRTLPYRAIIIAVIVIAVVSSAVTTIIHGGGNSAGKEDYVDKVTIDKIFQQATDLLEDSDY